MQVEFGKSQVALLSDDGDVYTWGWGGSFFHGCGALGHGDTDTRTTPTLVETFAEDGINVTQIASGSQHMLALSDEGEVFSWGQGEYGRLGNGGGTQKYPEPVELLLDVGAVKQIVAGMDFSAAVTEDGELYTWGRNDQGQLGHGAGMSLDMYSLEDYPRPVTALEGIKVKTAACGHDHMLCITEDDSV